MEKTIKNIISNFNELNKDGFNLLITKEDKRYTKAFDISLKELNDLLKPYNLKAEKDLGDPQEKQDTEIYISNLNEKSYINK